MKSRNDRIRPRSLLRFAPLILVILSVYLLTGCPFRFLTGIPCPGCGMTRAVWALIRLDFSAAFRYHPLVFLMPVYAALLPLSRRISERYLYLILYISVFLFAGVYVLRLCRRDPTVIWNIREGLLFRIAEYIGIMRQ